MSRGAASDAKALRRAGDDDPGTLSLLAEFYWCRFEAARDLDGLAIAAGLADRLSGPQAGLRPAVLGAALDVLDRFTAGADTGLDIGSDQDPAWAGLFYALYAVWAESPVRDARVLDRLVASMSMVVALTPDEYDRKATAMAQLGTSLTERGLAAGRRDDIEAAIAVSREALRRTPPGDPRRTMEHTTVCNALAVAYDQDGSVAAQVALAEALLASIAETGGPDPDTIELARAIWQAKPGSRDQMDAERALTLARLGVAVSPAGDPGRPAALFALAAALSQRAGDYQAISDNEAAIAAMRELADLEAAHRPDTAILQGLALTFLGRYLFQGYELTGDPASLDEALAVTRHARDLLPPGHPVSSVNLINLGTVLLSLYQQRGDHAELDEATEILTAAASAATGSSERARALSVLSAVYYTRFRAVGTEADLERSVELGRQAVASTPPDDPQLLDWLSNLCNALRLRYAHGGSIADLDEAIDAARRAVDGTPAGHADRARYCQVLGGALMERYQETGDADDLEDAVTLMREAADRAGRGSATLLAHSSLGFALMYRYERLGNVADLDEAVALLRPAADEMPGSAEEYPLALNNLAAALSMRFQLTGATADLDDSITASRQALAASGPGISGTTATINLSQTLTIRFQMAGRREDIDEAISVLHAAVTKAGSAERPSIFFNLAAALSVRHDRHGTPADLDDAITATRSALDNAGAVRRARYHSMLGDLLATRARRPGQAGDLDAAVIALRTAERQASQDSPERALVLHRLSGVLLQRSAGSDRRDALDAARTASGVDTAPAQVQALAAVRWAAIAAEDGDLAEAVQGYERAVAMLPLLTWRGLSRADQERELSQFSGISTDAAAAAISVGRPELAVELLEQGRAVLWSQRLDTRSDLTALRRTMPDLAQRLAEVRAALDRQAGTGASPPVEHTEADRAPLAREWDRLITEVRSLPGFTDFLRPRPFAALAEAAGDGTVAIINVSQLRCDGLLIAAGAVRVIPLPDLNIEALTTWLNTLYAAFGTEPGTLGEMVAKRQMIAGLLQWLWDAVTGPVIGQLAGNDRLWWCPTGNLALLPLHAATDPRTGKSALNRVVSSYTPTLRALQEARSRAAESPRSTRPSDVLVVAVPHAPGAPELNVQPEVDAIVSRLSDRCTVLTGPDATFDRVRSELPRHRWLHFACHGTQNLGDPSHSALLLYDHPLSVLDTAELDLAGAEFAFLSACQTAGGGAVLADEAIHLAAALQASGFRQVIATLWPLYDAVAPEVTERVYAGLASGGGGDAGPLLHNAVRALRGNRASSLPEVWAPYIHIGS